MALLEGKPQEVVPRIGAVSVTSVCFRPSGLSYLLRVTYRRSCATGETTASCPELDSSPPIRSVFVPTQIINFWFVPPHLRFLVVSVVSLFWSKSPELPMFPLLLTIHFLCPDTYLSVANSMAKKQAEAFIEEKKVDKVAG